MFIEPNEVLTTPVRPHDVPERAAHGDDLVPALHGTARLRRAIRQYSLHDHGLGLSGRVPRLLQDQTGGSLEGDLVRLRHGLPEPAVRMFSMAEVDMF